MESYNEQLRKVNIRNDDDLWEAVKENELEDILDDILDYFFGDQIRWEEKSRQVHLAEEGISYRKPDEEKMKLFRHLFDFLGEKGLKDTINYFLQRFNENKSDEEKTHREKESDFENIERELMMLIGALDNDAKEYLLQYLTTEAFEGDRFKELPTIIQVRRNIGKNAPDNLNLKNAVGEALKNNFGNVIYFFRKNSNQIIEFIRRLNQEHPERFQEIMGGIILEFLNYLGLIPQKFSRKTTKRVA